MVLDTEESYVLFLNTILASCCSLFSGFGVWIFRGLFHQWIFNESQYLWTTHWLYAVFNVGCIGLFVTNLVAFATWTDSTGDEAYRVVFITNAVMHGIWGLHNLQMTWRRVRGTDENTVNVMRRPFPLGGWSAIGSCGSATVRNIYAAATPLNDLSMAVIIFTWVWEWIGFVVILVDFAKFMCTEFQWGAKVMSDIEIALATHNMSDSSQKAVEDAMKKAAGHNVSTSSEFAVAEATVQAADKRKLQYVILEAMKQEHALVVMFREGLNSQGAEEYATARHNVSDSSQKAVEEALAKAQANSPSTDNMSPSTEKATADAEMADMTEMARNRTASSNEALAKLEAAEAQANNPTDDDEDQQV